MQLHYNYTHDVMLMSLIVIHLLKSNMWHHENFWTLKIIFFLKYWSPLFVIIVNNGLKLWHMAQHKISTWHINYILENINKYLFK
jgi:hypothetical protein